jgi:tRNA nucleotidyltransferase/poly(A) polymerase
MSRILCLLFVVFASHVAFAQTESVENCTQQQDQVVHLLNAKNAAELAKVMADVGTKEGFQLLKAYRVFELSPRSTVAARNLLSTIPASEQANDVWLEIIRDTIGSYCIKSDKKYWAVEGTQDGYPQALSKAILLAPEFLEPYIRYSIVAVAANETNSLYADQMVKVCKVDRSRFAKSFSQLSVADQKEIRNRIFDPTHCRALYVHEQ